MFSGTITNDTWVPSTIPIPVIDLPDTLTPYSRSVTEYTSAATSCLAVLNNATIVNKCDEITSSVTDHFLEACIREFERAGSEHATTILHYSLIYYCVVGIGVDECSFDRYFYFCDDQAEDSLFAIWMIILIMFIVVFILIIIIVICWKKKKAQKDEHGTTLISRQRFDRTTLNMCDNEAMTETSFMKETHTGIGATGLPHAGRDSPEQWSSSAQSSRRQSVISTRDFFQSPIMFIGSPPLDTLAYEDGNVHSDSPSTTDQHISPLRKFFRKKSIGPSHVDHIHVHSASQDQLSNPLSSNQMKATVSEMLQTAHDTAGPQSPHPQPNYSSSSIIRGQQTPVPTFGADAPKSLFGTASPEPKFGGTTFAKPFNYTQPARLGAFASSGWAMSNKKSSRNIHSSPEGNEHVHTAVVGSKDDPFISDSRGATPGEHGGVSTKSQNEKPQIESTCEPTPWSKYTATLPPPMRKATEDKNAPKGETKHPKVKNLLDNLDMDEFI